MPLREHLVILPFYCDTAEEAASFLASSDLPGDLRSARVRVDARQVTEFGMPFVLTLLKELVARGVHVVVFRDAPIELDQFIARGGWRYRAVLGENLYENTSLTDLLPERDVAQLASAAADFLHSQLVQRLSRSGLGDKQVAFTLGMSVREVRKAQTNMVDRSILNALEEELVRLRRAAHI